MLHLKTPLEYAFLLSVFPSSTMYFQETSSAISRIGSNIRSESERCVGLSNFWSSDISFSKGFVLVSTSWISADWHPLQTTWFFHFCWYFSISPTMYSSHYCLLLFSLLILSFIVTPNSGLKNRICAASNLYFSFHLSTQVSLPYFTVGLDNILYNHNYIYFRIYLPKFFFIHPFSLLNFCKFSSKSRVMS